MIETMGWIGTLLLGLCAAPQTLLVIQQGHARGLSASFLWAWCIGELATLVYIYGAHGFDWPLLVNTLLNLVFVTIIIKYVYWPKNIEEKEEL